MEKHDKSILRKIWQVFVTLSIADCQSVFRNGTFYRVVWRSFSQSVVSEKHKRWLSSFSSKCLEFDVDSRNCTKHSENVVRFPHNYFWIGSFKFSQSWTGYLPSAVNVLTNTPKISSVTRETFFESTSLRMMKKHDKSALMEISQVFGTLSQVDSQSIFWSGTFWRVF